MDMMNETTTTNTDIPLNDDQNLGSFDATTSITQNATPNTTPNRKRPRVVMEGGIIEQVVSSQSDHNNMDHQLSNGNTSDCIKQPNTKSTTANTCTMKININTNTKGMNELLSSNDRNLKKAKIEDDVDMVDEEKKEEKDASLANNSVKSDEKIDLEDVEMKINDAELQNDTRFHHLNPTTNTLFDYCLPDTKDESISPITSLSNRNVLPNVSTITTTESLLIEKNKKDANQAELLLGPSPTCTNSHEEDTNTTEWTKRTSSSERSNFKIRHILIMAFVLLPILITTKQYVFGFFSSSQPPTPRRHPSVIPPTFTTPSSTYVASSTMDNQNNNHHPNNNDDDSKLDSMTLRQFLSHPDGFHLALAPAFFGFYVYFGVLTTFNERVLSQMEQQNGRRILPSRISSATATTTTTTNTTIVPQDPLLKSVAGASAGAMGAILIAAGLNPRESAEFASSMTLSKFADFPGVGGVFKGDLFEEIMKNVLNSNDDDCSVHLEDGYIPVAVTGFDLKTLRGKILTKGCMGRAARASATFPGLFQPVLWDHVDDTILQSSSDGSRTGERSILIDGGITDPYGLLGLSALLPHEKQKRVVNLVVGAYDSKKGPPGPSLMPQGLDAKHVVSISIRNSPQCGPWAMSNGPRAVKAAMLAMDAVLDVPMYKGREDGHYILEVDVSAFVPN